MVSQGIFNILMMNDPDDGDVKVDTDLDGDAEGEGKRGPSHNLSSGHGIKKFPSVACLVALIAVYLMVQDANRQVFVGDFEKISRKIQDAFVYETRLKTFALRDAAASVITGNVGRAKHAKKLARALHEESALEMFQARNAATQQVAGIERLTLHPLALDSLDQQRHERTTTCPQEGSRKIREHALQVIQQTGYPVTSEAWLRKGESGEDVKSTFFYPIATPDENQVVGAVAADIKWADFFSHTTFDFGANQEGLIIAVENTIEQSFTFRVTDGHLAFVGAGLQPDPAFEEMMVVSDYARLVLSEISSSSNFTENAFCGCEYRIRIYPSTEMYLLHASTWSHMLSTGIILIIFTLFLFFLVYDVYITTHHSNVKEELARFYNIVGALFPRVVLERVVKEAVGLDSRNVMSSAWSSSNKALAAPTDLANKQIFSRKNKNTYLADCHVPEEISDAITTQKPIFNSFPHTSICFMDIAGFTSWCSERDPEQVFKLLETAYQVFDQIANRLGVFKIETIGDCYVAVTGVPEFQKDHCLVMVRFVYESMVSFIRLAKSLEVALGPGTGDLAIRAGIHSGPVIAGVIRAEKFRFQLFGDTMNVASRMESTGMAGRIQLSQDAATLVEHAGKRSWLIARDDAVQVKGKGAMKTYWVKISPDEARLINPPSKMSTKVGDMDESLRVEDYESEGMDRQRLIDWNTEVLLDLLRKVVTRRRALQARYKKKPAQDYSRDSSKVEYKKYVAQRSLVDHVAEVIPIANYEKDLEQECPSKINLGPKVEAQARAYVEQCAALYNDVAFHNFQHASHVVLSANNLLGQIIMPEKGGFEPQELNAKGGSKISRDLHDRTYGISCDPLMHFAAVQAAMIHDVAHLGVTNKQLVKINREMAARYDGRSVAEQHSLVLSMHVFADDKYKDLREALLANDPEETKRYYQFMISSVLATDIADKELKAIRQRRWDDAFEDEQTSKQAKDRLRLDDFYLGELARIEWHFRVSSFVCVLLWMVLVYVAYQWTPDDQIVVLDGWERKAEIVAFCFIICSYMYNAVPHLIKVFEPNAAPMSGAVVGVITIKTFALVTNGIMALGVPVPVLVDPVMGNKVYLLRMCEWAPMAFLIYFISDGVDVPDKHLGLRGKYFFGLCQGVSTFFGFLFPFAPNPIVWGFELFFSVTLYMTIYPHLLYKRKAFSKLNRGVSADDKEIYDRSQEALKFLETLWETWSELVIMFLLEGIGPLFTPLLNFTRIDGFGIAWMAFIDCYPKMKYVNHISKLHEIVFDTTARAERQKQEARRLKHLSNKKATILFEYIIQASDVAHCMQHWSVYQKFNRRLFEEQLTAYLNGHTEDDPRPGWYKGEIWFFENYIIPLAQKLVDSGCFGVAGHEYLRCATANLHEWKVNGEAITAKMIESTKTRLGNSLDHFEKGVNKSPDHSIAETAETEADSYTSGSDSESDSAKTSPKVRVPRFGLHGQLHRGSTGHSPSYSAT